MVYKSATLGKLAPGVYNILTYDVKDMVHAYSKIAGHHKTVEPAILYIESVFKGQKVQGAELKKRLLDEGFSEYASKKAVRTISHKASRGRIRNTMKHKMKVKPIKPEKPKEPPTQIYRTLAASNYIKTDGSNYDIEIRVWYQTYSERPDYEMEIELSNMWNRALTEASELSNPEFILSMVEAVEIGEEINTPISINEVTGKMETWYGVLMFGDRFKYDLLLD